MKSSVMSDIFVFCAAGDMGNIWKLFQPNVEDELIREKHSIALYASCAFIPYKPKQIYQTIKQSNFDSFCTLS